MSRRAQSASASPSKPTPIPAKFWRPCAGISAQDPPVVNSRVYYFPQGHIDQAASKPRNLSPLVYSKPVIPCRVSAVNFFADPNTDEVFLKILLHPVAVGSSTAQDFPPPAEGGGGNGSGNGDDEKVESYAKILTRSDANNGGGFSVPRACADLIFPPLNFEDDLPVQTLRITDLHGAVWEFRHVYRGKPKRHLFTSGWSKFVDSKMLISGDSLIFMKDSDGRMFVGLRRNMSPDDGLTDADLDWLDAILGTDEGEKEEEEELPKEGFARNGKGRVSSASVAEAMELAAQNKAFEVVYYPNVGWGEFVVKAEDVEVNVNGIVWRVGMIVKMARENLDSSRMIWFQGIVCGVSVPAHDQPWSGSPWRMLQVKWNDSEMLMKIANFVSPWQVELLSDAPSVPAALVPPTKKFRTTDGEEEPFFSRLTFPIPDSAKGLLKEALLSYYAKTSPAGMQEGANHDVSATPTCPIFPSNNSPMSMGNSCGNSIVVPRLNTMLMTEPNVGTCKRSFQLFGCTIQSEQPTDERDGNSSSFQLFGRTIRLEPADESGAKDDNK
ncbi:Arf17p [Stylosanthes scabra]|uniref:Auxin response factor n=1 Tax=Stylosanthes scabra TaxID=79078 RepID=A0ABU6X0S5_9FABA|nr:Arf17p [Stylosanthes scabra]